MKPEFIKNLYTEASEQDPTEIVPVNPGRYTEESFHES